MATVKKKINKKGVVYRVDWYDPEGRRKRKDFEKKKDAEAYRGKIDAAKKEKRYHEVFDVKEESQVTFDELADRYVENFQGQRCFSRLKYYLVNEYRAAFGARRLSEITYLSEIRASDLILGPRHLHNQLTNSWWFFVCA